MKISIAIFFLLFCSAAFAQQDQTVTIVSGGIQRTFDVHLPPAKPQNMPVLFAYHGTGGTSAGMAATSKFNDLADKNSFIAVYPQAVQIGGDIQWNVFVDDKPGHAGVGDDKAPDDVQFTHDMIDKLAADYSIDRKRVYASGLSNGGFMCYALAFFAYNDIAAIAPVAGNLWGDNDYITKLYKDPAITPIPVMHVHGTADGTVDYPDPDNTPVDYGEYPLWVVSRGCGATTYTNVVPIMANVDKLVFCPPPVEVSLIRIKGMDHSWSNGVYPTSQEIVKFFGLNQVQAAVTPQSESHSLQVLSSVADRSVEIILKNPAQVEILNSIGEVVYAARQIQGSSQIPTQSLSSGIYFLKASTSSGEITVEKVLVHH